MGADRTSPGKECPIIWRGRRAKAFVPSMLDVRSIDLSSVTRSRTAVAAAEISSTAASMPSGHVPLARLLSRAEGVASSYLEGVAALIADIVMAEADGGELATPAALVASNFAAITSAVDSAGDELTTEMLCAWQRTVVHGSPLPSRYVGVIRDEQGWIGGTSPLDAALVTSPPDRLPGLLEDLVGYSNRSDLDPVAQAAIVHAQFEIIHPFAVIGAGQARRDLIGAVEALEVQWRRRLAGSRSGGRDGIEGHAGRRVRRDALAWQVLDLLPGHLVLSAAAVATELGASLRASTGALNELVDVGILALYERTGRRSPGRPALLYVSPELLGVAGSNPVG